MKSEEFKTVVQTVYKTLETAGYYQSYPPTEEEISHIISFMNRINPEYPLDSVNLLDMVNVAIKHEHVPPPPVIDALERLMVDFSPHNIEWTYLHPTLTMNHNSDGERCEIIFAPEIRHIALSFPLTITVNKWANMDLDKNHDPDCPCVSDMHLEDCPVSKLYAEKGDSYSEDEIVRAKSECTCEFDDCGCESFIEHTRTRMFNSRDEFLIDFTAWLNAAYYDMPYNSVFRSHKFTLTVNDRQMKAECSCGEWMCITTNEKRNQEYLHEKWYEHTINS